jgi:hypothetical protein
LHLKQSEILAQALGIVLTSKATAGYAKTKNGDRVDVLHPKACSWCAAGAVRKVCNDALGIGKETEAAIYALHRAASVVTSYITVFQVNDSEPSETLTEVFQHAIAEAKKAEGAC